MTTHEGSGALVEHVFRHEAGRMVARLVRLLGPAHVSLAEETVQEAMLRALQVWPHHGMPDNPGGWLFRVAHNIAIDSVRRVRTFGDKTEAIVAAITRSAATPAAENDSAIRDEELQMIFMCCHPDLSREASVALSLKTIGGFSVREIARAFLADEATIAQRLVRAKRRIRDRRLSLDLPSGRELAERVDGVLAVIYLMFNEGYAAHEGANLIRQDLCAEALRLGLLVASARLESAGAATPQVHALVALMALQAARLPARTDDAGDMVLLEDQDRARWDHGLIRLGFEHFDRSLVGPAVSRYHIQAALAATHVRATDAAAVDWPLILNLYDQLVAVDPSAVVALNRAVAVARVHGPAQALHLVEQLDEEADLRHYHLLLAVKGDLLLALDRGTEAADCFRSALECSCSEPERRFLRRKLDGTASGLKLGPGQTSSD